MNILLSTARKISRSPRISQRQPLETSDPISMETHPSYREMLFTQFFPRPSPARLFAIARFRVTHLSSPLRRFAREREGNFSCCSSRCRRTNRIVATENSAKLNFHHVLRRRKRSTHAILSAMDGWILFDRRELN